VVISVNFGEEN